MSVLEHLIEWRMGHRFPDAASWRTQLANAVSLSPEALLALNWERRRSLVEYAYNNIPFYREKYDRAGFNPKQLKAPADFAMVPLLTKQEVREHTAKLIFPGERLDKLTRISTGGSTGEPLTVYRDPTIPYIFFGWDLYRLWGIRLSDSCAIVARKRVNPPLRRAWEHLKAFPRKTAILDANEVIDDTQMMRFAGEIKRYRPTYVRGYVGGIMQFALFCEKRQLTFPSLKVVWTTSAPLPESQREIMERIFQCPVFTQYGCCEIPHLATECPAKHGMHFYAHLRHIEAVNDNGAPVPDGEYGSVAVTNLIELKFPLIRYLNNDRAAILPERCSCGSNLPLMSYVRGRVSECFQFSDGSVLAGDFLTTVFDAYPAAVRGFQFVQHRNGDVRLRVLKSPQYPNAEKEIGMVCARMEQLLKGKANFILEEVESIAHDHGKTRFILKEEN